MEQTPHQDHNADPEEQIVDSDLSWEAPEYHHHMKTRDWYWTLAMVSGTIAIISILLGDFLFALFIILAAITLAIVSRRPPRMITIHVGNAGILVDKTLYLYKDIESFWIDLEEREQKILLKSKHFFMPYIVVPLAGMDHDVIGDYLAEHLPEIEQKEPLLQRLLEDFGF
jgi:hypothetical protein